MLILVLAASLLGCGNQLSEKFDEDTLKENARNMITEIQDGNLESVYNDTFNVVMQNSIPMETLQENIAYVLGNKGAFVSFGKEEVKGIQDKNTGTE